MSFAGTASARSAPSETFGAIRPSLAVDVRRANLRNLLTAARAYINAEHKHRSHAVDRLDLALHLTLPLRCYRNLPKEFIRLPLVLSQKRIPHLM